MEKIRIEQHSSIGMLWLAGWLFTLGFLDLGFWRGVWALVVTSMACPPDWAKRSSKICIGKHSNL